ncbi:spore germination protein [Paenibacillus aestuarii]|uniref:Spore germination protein n=1 Tax=Paenibacillus aestuarii TaxID=516965 RepID=A0ABW0KDR2_9BACL|nr:spore germination protein [Paenibacillus aestuarii]
MQMSSKIGAFKVITNSGTIINGESLIIMAPTQISKSFNGAGAGVTGAHAMTFSFFSTTIALDPAGNGELSKYRRKRSGHTG